MNSFLSLEELEKIPFKSIGKNVLISRHASIYSPERISIGINVRVDDFCILSGNIVLGNNIHIAAYSALYGGQSGIQIDDFSNISSRVCIYAISDDYSGYTMTNPTIPEKYKHIQDEPVYLGKHVIVGSGCTILPGVILAEGAALGAMSLCKKSVDAWTIYAGIPARKIKQRRKELLDLEKEFERENDIGNSIFNA